MYRLEAKVGRGGLALVAALIAFALLDVFSDGYGIVAHHRYLVFGGPATYAISVQGGDDTLIYTAGAVPGGWRNGDRFDSAALGLPQRLELYYYQKARPGERLDVDVLRDGRRLRLHLVPTVVDAGLHWQGLEDVRVLVFDALSLAGLAIAVWLVCVLPGPLTWSFLLWTFWFEFSPDVRAWPLPLPGMAAFWLLTAALTVQSACVFWFVLFCARFPDDRPFAAARVPLLLAAIGAAILMVGVVVRNAAGVLYPIASLPSAFIDDRPGSFIYTFGNAAGAFVCGLGVLVASLRYRAAEFEARVKVQLVFAAIALSAASVAGQAAYNLFVPYHAQRTLTDELLSWCTGVGVFVPVAVVVTIVRHRILDVRFVLDRALVYLALSLLVLGALKLVGLAVSAELSRSGVGFTVDAAVAVAFALSIERIRPAVERALHTTVYRAHERALAQLSELSSAIGMQTSRDNVDDLLTDGAAAALSLTFAALYVGAPGDDGLHVRAATNWPSVGRIAAEVLARIGVSAGRGAVRIGEREAAALGMRGGSLQPALLVPLDSALGPAAVALFGGHRSGADLDPREAAALTQLAGSAARAYDRIEAAALRSEVAEPR